MAQPGSGQWNYSGMMGALTLCTDRTYESYFIRLLDVQDYSVQFEQEFYNNFLYFSPRPYFHAFETNDGIGGFSFADQKEAQQFFSEVIKCKTKSPSSQSTMSRSVSTPNLGNRPSPNPSRPNPDPNGTSLETTKQRKKREKKEKEEKRARQKREAKLRKKQDQGGKSLRIEGPTNVTHVSSIGWDPSAGFQIRNIPPEWKRLFKDAGVKKSDLENPETSAAFIAVSISHWSMRWRRCAAGSALIYGK